MILVTWNGWSLLERCLASLEASRTTDTALEVVVVDNASDDGTAERLASRFPDARYLPLPTNVGFAAANNRGLALASSPLVLLLNNDTVVQRGAVDQLIATAEAQPAFDVFVPQMIRLREPHLVDNRGIYVDATGHFRQLDAGRPVAEARPACELFGGSGGALLVRRRLLDRCGLFDESLGSYLEDADFACRARSHGARTLYVPAAHILHEGSATGERIADRKLHLIQRNMLVVGARWLPFRPWGATGWLGVAYEAWQVVRAARAGRLAIVVRAKQEGWRAARTAKRRPRGGSPAAIRRWVGVQARPLSCP